MFHGIFPKEEVGKIADVVGGDKVGFCQSRVKKEEKNKNSETEPGGRKNKISEGGRWNAKWKYLRPSQ